MITPILSICLDLLCICLPRMDRPFCFRFLLSPNCAMSLSSLTLFTCSSLLFSASFRNDCQLLPGSFDHLSLSTSSDRFSVVHVCFISIISLFQQLPLTYRDISLGYSRSLLPGRSLGHLVTVIVYARFMYEGCCPVQCAPTSSPTFRHPTLRCASRLGYPLYH